MSEVAIVGEDEEPFGFFIESANVVEVLVFCGDEGVDGVAVEFVVFAADEALWFVEEDGFGLEGLDAFAIDFDEVFVGDTGGGVGFDFTINDDEALLDHLIARSSGANAA